MPKNKTKHDKTNKESEYVLDKFSDVSLQEWNKLSELLDEFNVKLFYNLESQRNLHYDDLLEALRESSALNLYESDWWRFVDFAYSDEFLSARGSIINGGRFNIGQDINKSGFQEFPALYIAENEDVARMEKFCVPKVANSLSDNELALRSPTSYTAVRLAFHLENIFDLTKEKNLKQFLGIISKFTFNDEVKKLAKKIGNKQPHLITKTKELQATLMEPHWRHNPMQYSLPSNSQIFARMVKDAGFDGIIYNSSKFKKKKCLAVFSEQLENNEGYVQLMDNAPKNVDYDRLDAKSWKKLV